MVSKLPLASNICVEAIRSILKILYVFLRSTYRLALILNPIERFEATSIVIKQQGSVL